MRLNRITKVRKVIYVLNVGNFGVGSWIFSYYRFGLVPQKYGVEIPMLPVFNLTFGLGALDPCTCELE